MTHSSVPDARAPLPALTAKEVVRHGALLALTATSMVVTYASMDDAGIESRVAWVHGAQFATSLLLILISHELGHYVAARIHRVDSTLPFFIPAPLLSPFGTMGAVIRMRGAIPSRKALLDIGASGPLAGLLFAIPLYAWGIHHSPVVPEDPSLGATFGDSVLSRLLDLGFGPHVPDGQVQVASPVLFAAWAGFFVTMLNLLPIGQLDGGHIAYALFGRRQNRLAPLFHRGLLAFFFVSLTSYIARDLRHGIGFVHLGKSVNESLFWLVWFEILGVLGAVTRPDDAAPDENVETVTPRTRIVAVLLLVGVASVGREHLYPTVWAAWFVGLAVLLVMELRGGTLRPHRLFDHPDVGTEELGPARTGVAIVALASFAALFMPTPISL